jgi:peptidyl-prolyl cis-trans isomerase C
MKKVFAAALVAGFSFAAFAQNAAIVNGKPIPSSRVDAMMKQVTSQGQKDTPELRSMVRQELVNREILAQEAERRGLTDTPDFKLQMDTMRQQLLIRALVQDVVKSNPPTDAEIQAAYDEQKKQASGTEYRARHILVEKEEQARKIIADLAKGQKFEALAKQSKDPGSAANGGDLDWAPADAYVPEFSKAMTALKKGEYTRAPVKSQFGWHVIRLDDTRQAQFPPLDQVRPQLTEMVQQQKLRAFQEDLTKKAKVE